MYIVYVCVCACMCVFVWPIVNWPLAPLSPIVNTVHPKMYTQSVPLPVCVSVCVCVCVCVVPSLAIRT